jgi:hypothetical protein
LFPENQLGDIEIIFILFLNTTLFYNFMLRVNRYLAMNTFCRSMTYYQKSYSLPLKGLRPLIFLLRKTILSWDNHPCVDMSLFTLSWLRANRS